MVACSIRAQAHSRYGNTVAQNQQPYSGKGQTVAQTELLPALHNTGKQLHNSVAKAMPCADTMAHYILHRRSGIWKKKTKPILRSFALKEG